MKNTLNPCKCGGEAKVVSEAGMIDYVECKKCGKKTATYFDGVPYAVYEWNSGRAVWGVNDE
jgi:uncharacterized protein CbrC (UPF0167 family)